MISVIEYYAKALTKSRASLISFAIKPLSFIFLLTLVSGGKLFSTALIGGMVSFVAGVGVADLAIEIAGMKTRSKFYDILSTLPLHPLKLGLGISVGMSIPALPYLVVLIFTLAYVWELSLLKIAQIILLLAFLWLWSVFVGLYIGVKFREPIVIMRVSNIALTALTILAPVYYPLEVLPKALHRALLLLPTAGCAYLIRSLHEPLSEWKMALAGLTLWTLLFGVLAFRDGIFKEE